MGASERPGPLLAGCGIAVQRPVDDGVDLPNDQVDPVQSILSSRPIYHKCDETIRGHVFCSFLALVLMKELQRRLADRGWTVEWDRLKDDLDNLTEITVRAAGKGFVIRSVTRGQVGKAVQAAGVALGPVVRPLPDGPH